MIRVRTRQTGAAAAVAALLLCVAAGHPSGGREADLALGPARAVAPGVDLYHLNAGPRLDPPGPLSIWILRLDPARVDLQPALARDQIMETETVADLAARRGAVAAVNAGFFLPNGDPSGLYKLNGQLVSDTHRLRGAVGIIRDGPAPRLVFGRVSARLRLRLPRRARPDQIVEIAGVDTTRLRGRLMLFTPAYHPHTDTAAGGLEWTVSAAPHRIAGAPRTEGRTAIPAGGFVLSYGGRTAPAALRALQPGARIHIEPAYAVASGHPDVWTRASDIVCGAGLLARDGRFVDDWAVEALAPGFAAARHPRTMIGTRPDGSVWLVTVDGRQPGLSAGMTLPELRDFARRLGLTNALNLDGGGSTTMWVRGQVVNSPSDATGPRKVSDALLVTAAPRPARTGTRAPTDPR